MKQCEQSDYITLFSFYRKLAQHNPRWYRKEGTESARNESSARRRHSGSSHLNCQWINSGMADSNRSLLSEDTKQSSSATIMITTTAPAPSSRQRLTATVRNASKTYCGNGICGNTALQPAYRAPLPSQVVQRRARNLPLFEVQLTTTRQMKPTGAPQLTGDIS